MDSSLLVVLVYGLVVLGTVVYMVKVGGRKVSSLEQARNLWWHAQQLVDTYAPAADQLVKLGEIDKEERLDYVVSMVMGLVDELDYEQIRGLVEAWVVDNKKDKAVAVEGD